MKLWVACIVMMFVLVMPSMVLAKAVECTSNGQCSGDTPMCDVGGTFTCIGSKGTLISPTPGVGNSGTPQQTSSTSDSGIYFIFFMIFFVLMIYLINKFTTILKRKSNKYSSYDIHEEENEFSPKKILICPHCDAENKSDAKFCNSCGKALRKSKR